MEKVAIFLLSIIIKMGNKKPHSLKEKMGFKRSGTDETRTRDLRLDRPAF